MLMTSIFWLEQICPYELSEISIVGLFFDKFAMSVRCHQSLVDDVREMIQMKLRSSTKNSLQPFVNTLGRPTATAAGYYADNYYFAPVIT